MLTIKLTPEQYKILTNPTRIEEWGAQQEIALDVQAQVLALDSNKRVTLDDFDIGAINKSIEVNHEGAFIAWGRDRTGGWATNQWKTSVAGLKAAVRRSTGADLKSTPV